MRYRQAEAEGGIGLDASSGIFVRPQPHLPVDHGEAQVIDAVGDVEVTDVILCGCGFSDGNAFFRPGDQHLASLVGNKHLQMDKLNPYSQVRIFLEKPVDPDTVVGFGEGLEGGFEVQPEEWGEKGVGDDGIVGKKGAADQPGVVKAKVEMSGIVDSNGGGGGEVHPPVVLDISQGYRRLLLFAEGR